MLTFFVIASEATGSERIKKLNNRSGGSGSMKFYKLLAIAASTAILALSVATTANALSISINPTADGDVQDLVVDTGDTRIGFNQSGGLIRNGILEFDLSGIANGSTINSASLDITLTRFVSNTGSNPAAIDVFAYNGDGVVNIADFNAAGTQVVNTTTPQGGSSGDVRSFTFTSVAPIAAALIGDLLTLRIETDSFASILFASLENATLNAALLSIDFTEPVVSVVPLPAALPLFGSGLAVMGFIGWRRKRLAA